MWFHIIYYYDTHKASMYVLVKGLEVGCKGILLSLEQFNLPVTGFDEVPSNSKHKQMVIKNNFAPNIINTTVQ